MQNLALGSTREVSRGFGSIHCEARLLLYGVVGIAGGISKFQQPHIRHPIGRKIDEDQVCRAAFIIWVQLLKSVGDFVEKSTKSMNPESKASSCFLKRSFHKNTCDQTLVVKGLIQVFANIFHRHFVVP